MSLSKFTQNINYHQNQPDRPVLTPSQLKILFDQAGIDIKTYLNATLTTEIDNLINTINSNINTHTSSINTLNTNLRKEDILNTPVSSNIITSGSNLNSFMTCGIYTSNSGEISGTLINAPFTDGAFKLIVEYLHDSSRIRQTVYANNDSSYTYVRTYNGSWGRWIKQPSYSIYDMAISQIESNSNLNSYIKAGTYFCGTGSVAQTLTNCPVITGFKLKVEILNNSERYRQTIYSNNSSSETYVRTYSSDGWGRWIKQLSYSIYEVPLTEIAENTNINNLFAPGTYFCPTGAVAQTLKNCPATTGFKLISEQLHNSERYRQTIYTNTATSDTYVRTYTGTWGRWMKINMTAL